VFKRVEAGVVKRAPAEGVAGLDDLVKSFALAFTKPDGSWCAGWNPSFQSTHNVRRQLWGEPLAGHPAQRIGKPRAHLFLLVRLKHTEDTVDGFAGVDCVERAQNQVAGFRRAQGDFHRVAVAHFADENHLGRLAQRGAQTVRVGIEIHSEFALVERGLLVLVQIFDRVFQRDDVDRLGAVDLVENGRERGGFAGAGRAGDQDQAGFFLGESFRESPEISTCSSVGIEAFNWRHTMEKLPRCEKTFTRKRAFRRQANRTVARTVPQQIFDVPEVVADDVHHDGLDLERRQLFNGRIKE
jgi:hypothetical protein